MNRGDVLLARFPHASGGRGKKRPVVLVQADAYGKSLPTLVVAEVTKNLSMASDPACLFIDAATPEGKATGVLQDSVVSGLLLATIKADRVDRAIGVLSDSMKQTGCGSQDRAGVVIIASRRSQDYCKLQNFPGRGHI